MRLQTLVLSLAVLVFCMTGALAAQEPIKIGGLFDLTGTASNIGSVTRNVALMGIEEINKHGGVKGRMLELVVADTESEPSKAVIALRRLVEKDKVVAIIGPTTTGAAMACMPVIEELKIPVIGTVGGDAPVEPVHKWFFKTPQKTSTAVERLFTYLKAHNLTTIGLLCATDKFGQEGQDMLKKMAPKYGITIRGCETFNTTDIDMSAQIAKVNATNVNAIVAWTIGPAGPIIAKDVKLAKIKTPLFQCHGQPDHNYIKLGGMATHGTMMPATKLMVADDLSKHDPQREELLHFKEIYHAKNLGMVGTHSGYAWDALQIMARAMEKAGTEPEALRTAIENTKHYVGISGIYTMSPTDHCGLTADSLVMVKVLHDRWILVK